MNRRYIKITIIITVALFAGIGGIAIPTLLHPDEGAEALNSHNSDIKASQIQSKHLNSEFIEKQYLTESLSKTSVGIDISSEEVKPNITSTESSDALNQVWIEAKIEEYRNQIANEDLEDFRYIIGKLDMNYVNEIIEGRYGSEIDFILKEYLHYKLTSTEYNRARDLFYAYNHLLF